MDVKNNITFYKTAAESKGARLVAVSKTHPIAAIREAFDAGQRIFGENKVQELTAKAEELSTGIEWHMIGHLQSNKVKYVVPFVSLIHAIDSIKLLEEVDRQGKKINRVIPCLLQVHIAKEETKFGFGAEELIPLFSANAFGSLHFVRIEGLMGMATLTEDKEKIRQEFRGLKSLFDQIKKMTDNQMKELSMGMSSDYEIALEEGSTLVRIGSSIFGKRDG